MVKDGLEKYMNEIYYLQSGVFQALRLAKREKIPQEGLIVEPIGSRV